jgi:hypothetical protein
VSCPHFYVLRRFYILSLVFLRGFSALLPFLLNNFSYGFILKKDCL